MELNKNAVEQLKKILKNEVEKLKQFSRHEQKLQHYIMDHDWENSESAIQYMTVLSDSIIDLEKKKENMMSKLKNNSNHVSMSVHELIDMLGPSEKKEFTELIRALSTSVYTVKNLTNGIDAYVASNKSTLESIVEEIFPERKGKIYSRQGKAQMAQDSPLVVSRTL